MFISGGMKTLVRQRLEEKIGSGIALPYLHVKKQEKKGEDQSQRREQAE